MFDLGMYFTILMIISVGLIGFALGYTFIVLKQQRVLKSELDTQIPEVVQRHPYLRNPIFLSFGIFFLVAFIAIILYGIKYSG